MLEGHSPHRVTTCKKRPLHRLFLVTLVADLWVTADPMPRSTNVPQHHSATVPSLKSRCPKGSATASMRRVISFTNLCAGSARKSLSPKKALRGFGENNDDARCDNIV